MKSASADGFGEYIFSTDYPGEFTITVEDGTGNIATTTITSFGPTEDFGGAMGSIDAPRQATRAGSKGPTYSGNTLPKPITIMGNADASYLDLSRKVVYANKGLPVSTCEGNEFVPGELLVKLKSGASLKAFAESQGLFVKEESPSGIHLIGLNVSGLDAEHALARTKEICIQLNKVSDVAYSDLNYISQTESITPNDPYYSKQWHYPMIYLPLAWEITTGSSDVIVAVVDTGIVAGHEDLQGRLTAGYDFASHYSLDDCYTGLCACDGDGIDNNPEDVADSRCIMDGGPYPLSQQWSVHTSYHGTHVAGTIGAATNNNFGVAGVDWAAKIMPIRVIGGKYYVDKDLIQALYYAAGLPNTSGTVPARKANIVNLSLGSERSCPATINYVLNDLYNAGVTVVVSAGNTGDEETTCPLSYLARCNHTISVGAVNRGSERAFYSCQGSGLTIAAPGGDEMFLNENGVFSTVRNDTSLTDTDYRYMMGTSQAAPHISGVAALMLAANPALTPDQIATILSQTAMDLGTAGTDSSYGAGLVNAYKAVAEAKRLVSPTLPQNPMIAVSKSQLIFTEDEASKTIKITNVGYGSLTLTSISDTENSGGNWLAASAREGVGSIELDVTVSRGDLSRGTYTGTIHLVSNGGNADVNVTVYVGDAPIAVPEGCQNNSIYILAFDAMYFYPVSLAIAPMTRSSYTIQGLPSGSYYLFAGTDCDNDDYICDQDMDYCGAYPSIDSPAAATVTGMTYTPNIGISVARTSARGTGLLHKMPISRVINRKATSK